MVANGLYNIDKIDEFRINFKKFLEKEFLASKNYKSELKWFDGVWSRFKPGLGKDKRCKWSRYKKNTRGRKKISLIPDGFAAHKTLRKVFEQRSRMFNSDVPIDWATAELLAFLELY